MQTECHCTVLGLKPDCPWHGENPYQVCWYCDAGGHTCPGCGDPVTHKEKVCDGCIQDSKEEAAKQKAKEQEAKKPTLAETLEKQSKKLYAEVSWEGLINLPILDYPSDITYVPPGFQQVAAKDYFALSKQNPLPPAKEPAQHLFNAYVDPVLKKPSAPSYEPQEVDWYAPLEDTAPPAEQNPARPN